MKAKMIENGRLPIPPGHKLYRYDSGDGELLIAVDPITRKGVVIESTWGFYPPGYSEGTWALDYLKEVKS